jgi:hypothetical protein
MNAQEAKRIRRKNRLNHPVRMTKKEAKELGIKGEHPIVKRKRNTGRVTFNGKKVSMRRRNELNLLKAI